MNAKFFALSACATLTVGCSSSDRPPPTDQAPRIAAVADQRIVANVPSTAIRLTIGDEEPATVTLDVAADNTQLLPTDGLIIDGSDADRTLTLVPRLDELGIGLISVTATDAAGQSSTIEFTVEVTPQQVSLLTFTRQTFVGGENGPQVLINAVEFTDDVGNDDFADLLAAP